MTACPLTGCRIIVSIQVIHFHKIIHHADIALIIISGFITALRRQLMFKINGIVHDDLNVQNHEPRYNRVKMITYNMTTQIIQRKGEKQS